jgi:hypothetical protein
MNPFEGKAIKFATEQELNHLAELARGYGLNVERVNYNEYDIYFRHTGHNGETYYTNCWKALGHTEITYSDFIASLESSKYVRDIDYEKSVKNIYPDAVLDVDSDRDGANSFRVLFQNKDTPFFATSNDAWKSAYLMLPPTPTRTEQQPDMVNHPPHYTVNGIEVIDVIENYKLNYKLGNVVKYVLRADLKGNRLQDLKKALWYLQREIEQSEKQK